MSGALYVSLSEIHTAVCCNTGHAGVIRQLSCRGFRLTDFDGVEDIEHLLMVFDQLHHVHIIPVKSIFAFVHINVNN